MGSIPASSKTVESEGRFQAPIDCSKIQALLIMFDKYPVFGPPPRWYIQYVSYPVKRNSVADSNSLYKDAGL